MLTNMTKRILNALQGQKTDRAPFWFMRQAGRYLPEYRELREEAGSFLDLCFNPEFAAEVTLQPIRRFDMDAAILFSDILVIPYALGQEVGFVENEGPKLGDIVFKKLSFDIEKLNPIFQTIEKTKEGLSEDKTLIGFAGAPWTVATYMVEGGASRDYKKTKQLAEEGNLDLLMDILIKSTSEYLVKQVDHGAEVLQVFDSWASASPDFQKWNIEPTKGIVARVKAKHPDVPIIGFPRAVGENYKIYAEQTGVDALSMDETLDLDWALENIPEHICLQGNLHNQILLEGGEEMLKEAQYILDKMSTRPFIFNLGHGVIKETPPEHVAELSEYLKCA